MGAMRRNNCQLNSQVKDMLLRSPDFEQVQNIPDQKDRNITQHPQQKQFMDSADPAAPEPEKGGQPPLIPKARWWPRETRSLSLPCSAGCHPLTEPSHAPQFDWATSHSTSVISAISPTHKKSHTIRHIYHYLPQIISP